MKHLSKISHFGMIFSLLLLGCVIFLATPGKVSATSCTSVQSGDWDKNATWNKDCSPHGPQPGDDVTINLTHTITLPLYSSYSAANITINGTLISQAVTLEVTDNWVNNGVFNSGTGTVTFKGLSAQMLGGTSASTFHNLVIDNGNGVTLGNTQTVTNALTLTSGRVALGANNLALASAVPAVSGTGPSAMVVTNGSGALCKGFSAAGSFIFPVGDASPNYTPATLNFTAGTFSSGQACVRVTNARHPNNPLTADYINRYWTVTSSGISNFTCTAELAYNQADFTGTDEAGMSGLHYHAGSWTSLNAVDAANNKISGTVTGFSDFTAGKVGPTAVEINYFRAARAPGGVQLSWETVSEATLAGFNLYRHEAGGEFVQVNASLIPPQKGGQPEGYAYLYLDDNAALDQRYEYRLEAVETTLQVGSSALTSYWPYSIMLPVMRR